MRTPKVLWTHSFHTVISDSEMVETKMSLNEYLVYIVDRDFQMILGQEAAKLEGQI